MLQRTNRVLLRVNVKTHVIDLTLKLFLRILWAGKRLHLLPNPITRINGVTFQTFPNNLPKKHVPYQLEPNWHIAGNFSPIRRPKSKTQRNKTCCSLGHTSGTCLSALETSQSPSSPSSSWSPASWSTTSGCYQSACYSTRLSQANARWADAMASSHVYCRTPALYFRAPGPNRRSSYTTWSFSSCFRSCTRWSKRPNYSAVFLS